MVEQNYEKRLEKFYSGLNDKLQIYRKEKQSWDRFLSTDFNDFNVVSEFIRPNENRLSDIIACLLNANGSHGQGSKFLDAFLKRLFKENQTKRADELSGKGTQVKREEAAYYNDENQRRRIDITIDFKNFIIGIENKPWAGEGDRQLEAYYKHLKRKCEREDKKFCLVFITPNRRKPTSIDNSDDLIGTGELCLLSYNSDILDWIEECWQLCENDKFRWFLCDFREYIRAAFLSKNNEESKGDLEESKRDIILGHALKNENLKIVLDIVSVGAELEIREEIAKPLQMEISERDIMLNHILENEKNLEIAQDIMSMAQQIRDLIINNFWDELNVFIKARLDRSQWDFQELWDVTSKSLPLKKVSIGLAGTIGRVNEQFIGIHVKDESLEPSSPTWNLLKSKLEEKLKEGYDRKNEHWIWKTPDWEYKDWTDKDTLIKMHTKTDRVVTDIGKYLLKIIEVAEPVIDEWAKENPHNG